MHTNNMTETDEIQVYYIKDLECWQIHKDRTVPGIYRDSEQNN